ncbi:MAG: OprO/OprP family phosphate-selective porin [Crocinitomicaceae bacterium]|nr:OprO/OprP family phosphate-selective porin [Crocinitomicaceae bacterium]
MKATILLIIFFLGTSLRAQLTVPDTTTKKSNSTKKWFESINIRGYAQVRYNGLLQTNEDLECEQCDKSWGGENGFFFRRVRLIIYGQVNPRVYFYIQPDFASAPVSTNLNFAQLRDAYFDVGIDKENQFRFRIGQSKVPFGFENMQSSQNRLPLDRADAMNSAVSNERDLGVFFYYAPIKIRKRYSSLVSEGLKGSGDYGVFGLGIYNGQTANKPELNTNRHVVARISYPFAIKKQIIEPGIQAYKGVYTLSTLSSGVKSNIDKTYLDERIGATFVLYPKPFGILAEYNVGTGPEFDKLADSITNQRLSGGFITASYKIDFKSQTLIPFLRYQKYDGGKKHELDARSYKVEELEIGAEWQPNKNFELVVMYTMSSRRFEDYAKQNNYQRGNLLRIQAQVNF